MGAGGSAQGTWQLSAPAAELSACAGAGATWCGLLAGPPPCPCPQESCLSQPGEAEGFFPCAEQESSLPAQLLLLPGCWQHHTKLVFCIMSHTRPGCCGTPEQGSRLKAPVCPSRAVLTSHNRNGRPVLTSVHLQHLLLLFLGCFLGPDPSRAPAVMSELMHFVHFGCSCSGVQLFCQKLEALMQVPQAPAVLLRRSFVGQPRRSGAGMARRGVQGSGMQHGALCRSRLL